jgi:hypothetical protein
LFISFSNNNILFKDSHSLQCPEVNKERGGQVAILMQGGRYQRIKSTLVDAAVLPPERRKRYGVTTDIIFDINNMRDSKVDRREYSQLMPHHDFSYIVILSFVSLSQYDIICEKEFRASELNTKQKQMYLLEKKEYCEAKLVEKRLARQAALLMDEEYASMQSTEEEEEERRGETGGAHDSSSSSGSSDSRDSIHVPTSAPEGGSMGDSLDEDAAGALSRQMAAASLQHSSSSPSTSTTSPSTPSTVFTFGAPSPSSDLSSGGLSQQGQSSPVPFTFGAASSSSTSSSASHSTSGAAATVDAAGGDGRGGGSGGHDKESVDDSDEEEEKEEEEEDEEEEEGGARGGAVASSPILSAREIRAFVKDYFTNSFPGRVVSHVTTHQGVHIYKNKLSMTKAKRREVLPAEVQANEELLAQLPYMEDTSSFKFYFVQ